VSGFVLRLLGKAGQGAERSFALRLVQRLGDRRDPLQAMHLVTREFEHGHTGERRGETPEVESEDVYGVATCGRLLPIFASGEHEADGHALQVPLEGCGAGLVEVVDVEDETAIGRGVGAEIANVGVAADLREDAGVGQRGEIRGHDRHSAAKEAEGRSEHALVFQRDEGRHTSAHGAGNGGDRRASGGRRPPVRVLLSTQLFAAGLAQRMPLRGRNWSCHTW
jgi:hypothetical protein